MRNRLTQSAWTALLAALVVGCGAATPRGKAGGGQGEIPPPTGQMAVGDATPQGNNVFWNSTLEEGTVLPWATTFASPAQGEAKVHNEELCLNLTSAGANTYDVVLRQRQIPIQSGHKYQVVFKAHASAPTQIRPRVAKAGPPYTEYWSAVVDVGKDSQVFHATFAGTEDDETAEFAIHLGGPLAGGAPLTVCFDDLQLNDPQFEIPAGRQVGPLPKVRVNQVGYLPQYPKIATYKEASEQPVAWQLVDAQGQMVAEGQTQVFGEDPAAGERVHLIDFSSFKTEGAGYVLKAGTGGESFPFDIAQDVYRQLKYDALAYFYQDRSGIEIRADLVGDQFAHPAGHPGDSDVECAPKNELLPAQQELACDYSLDVSGGWYDAGDYGKYVVNGGIALWTMFDEFERLKYLGKTVGDFGDKKLKIPEAGNGTPDILDEARWEMEWMLRMQVPEGKPYAGMVHHKIHSNKWTPIPTAPFDDKVPRYLRPISTAATLNLVATAAQAARLFRSIDPAFSKRCLRAAQRGWAAAAKHPKVIAEGEVEGGGAYGDSTFTDEWYWAAAEMFITTGNAAYRKEFEKLPHHNRLPTSAGGGTSSMSWDHVSALGKISLSVVPSKLDKASVDAQRKQIVDAADFYLATLSKRGYRVPLASETNYPWGSNSFVLNDMVILGLAYDFTKDKKYIGGVIDSMDYILGRNPKVQSYVTGWGDRPLTNPHHRYWAHQKNPDFPPPPPGVVSGGPNSSLQDPYARKAGLPGCPPQKCFIDHIDSWSTNEIAINWNAPFAWALAFLDGVGRE